MKCLCLLLLLVSFAICIEYDLYMAILDQILFDARKFKASMFYPEFNGRQYIQLPEPDTLYVQPHQLIGWFAAIPSVIPTNQVFNSNRTEGALEGNYTHISTWLTNGEARFNFSIRMENFYQIEVVRVYSNYSTFNIL